MKRSAIPARWFICAALGMAPLMVSAQPAGGIYTAAQAQSGRAIYTQNCSACHGADFEGSGDAPALAGGTFMLKWRTRMVSELFGEIVQNMPPTNPGSLGEAAALNAAAYILERNGAPAGQRALTAGETALISAVATGQPPAATAQAQGNGGRAGAGGSMVLGAGNTAAFGRSDASVAHRVTVAGEVRNYVPVTPEMLKNPPPGTG
jgi:hypothetical protein